MKEIRAGQSCKPEIFETAGDLPTPAEWETGLGQALSKPRGRWWTERRHRGDEVRSRSQSQNRGREQCLAMTNPGGWGWEKATGPADRHAGCFQGFLPFLTRQE